MTLLVGIGLALLLGWSLLWLVIKIAIGAVHLLFLIGVALIAWGLVAG